MPQHPSQEPVSAQTAWCAGWCRRSIPAEPQVLEVQEAPHPTIRKVAWPEGLSGRDRVLASALRAGLTDQRVAHLGECLNVSRRTIERWRTWWLRDFAESVFWRDARARFMPPVATAALPASLLERFGGPDLSSQLVAMLSFLIPLSEGG
jgi:hypothetical protein